jgi:exopolysaccharide biosynthesis polyprenyl glycosylphosphotransferase
VIPRRFFWLFDSMVIAAAFVAAYLLVPRVGPLLRPDDSLRGVLDLPEHWNGQLPPLSESLWILFVMGITAVVVLGLLGGHGSVFRQSLTRIFAVGVGATLAGQSLVTLVMFTFKSAGWSRLLVYQFSFLTATGLISLRIILRKYMQARRSAGYYQRNVLLIGSPGSIEWILRYLETIRDHDYRPFGYLLIATDEEPADELKLLGDLRLLGDPSELGELLIHQPIDEVIAIHPIVGGECIKQIIQDCDYFGMPLRIVPQALLFGERKSLRNLYHQEPLHLPAVVLRRRLDWDSEALFFKRLFDIVVSAMLLVVLSPLLLLILIAIKLTTPGMPLFYHWKVVGRNGVEFTGYKFTTMINDADQAKNDLVEQNEMTGPVFKMKHDPRVTPLGKFLRKYSLNELPQLWSVLKGDMSLVGPRPAFRHELQRYEFWHKRKLSIQPGITCLWQVNGRNKINNFDDWVALDLEYIDNWSLWLDLKILMRTAKAVIAGTGS